MNQRLRLPAGSQSEVSFASDVLSATVVVTTAPGFVIGL